MTAPTDRQMAYRDALVQQALGNPPRPTELIDVRGRFLRVANAALALSFPTPATGAECSAQIDALRSGFAVWGAAHRAEGEAVVAKLTAAFGPDAAGAMTADPAEFRARVAAALA